MKWSEISEFLGQHGLGWMTLPMFAMTVAWAVMFFLKYLMRMRSDTNEFHFKLSAQMQHSFFLTEKLQDRLAKMESEQKELLKKAVSAMIDEAVKRAPPMEDPVAGVPFEEYRKDLWRMVEGEISIDEFVELWRGRKVQKRPKPEDVKQEEVAKKAIEQMAQLHASSIEQLEKARENNPEEEADRVDGVKELLGSGVFKEILKEWALHLKAGPDASGFANSYLGWMGDSSDPTLQHLTSIFANFIKSRSWDEVLEAILPLLDRETAVIFVTPDAARFFDSFRAMVMEAIRDYWENWLRKKAVHVGNYRFGQWLRVTRATSPAVGELVSVETVLPQEMRAEGRSKNGSKFMVGLRVGDFEEAYPKKGEWWTWTAVAVKEWQGDVKPDIKPFLWDVDVQGWLRDKRREEIKNMWLEPVNFGRGR